MLHDVYCLGGHTAYVISKHMTTLTRLSTRAAAAAENVAAMQISDGESRISWRAGGTCAECVYDIMHFCTLRRTHHE